MKTKLENPLLVAMNIKEGTKSNTNPNHNEHYKKQMLQTYLRKMKAFRMTIHH